MRTLINGYFGLSVLILIPVEVLLYGIVVFVLTVLILAALAGIAFIIQRFR